MKPLASPVAPWTPADAQDGRSGFAPRHDTTFRPEGGPLFSPYPSHAAPVRSACAPAMPRICATTIAIACRADNAAIEPAAETCAGVPTVKPWPAASQALPPGED